MKNDTIVLVVDFQADFTELHDGKLPVPGTDQNFIEQVNTETLLYHKEGFPIIATRDLHPFDHLSFCTSYPGKRSYEEILINGIKQKLWPPHCVEGTPGSRLLLPKSIPYKEIVKGFEQNRESYSAFFDDAGVSNGLLEILQINSIKKIIIYGLAIDYCVRETTKHAIQQGFAVDVRLDLCRGISPGNTKKSIREMEWEGAKIITSRHPFPVMVFGPRDIYDHFDYTLFH